MEGEILIRDLEAADPVPYELLLEADPSRQRIDEYMALSRCRIATLNSRCVGVYVLDNSQDIAEVMNIAVAPACRNGGLGKLLIADAIEQARRAGATAIVVCTGNSSISQIAFYQKCGFRMVEIVPDHFVDNYSERIVENGIWCRDQIRFVRDLNC